MIELTQITFMHGTLARRYNVIVDEASRAVVPSVNAKWEVKELSTPRPVANQVLIKKCTLVAYAILLIVDVVR